MSFNSQAQTAVTVGGVGTGDDQIGPSAYYTGAYQASVSLYRGTGTTDLTTWGYINGIQWKFDYTDSYNSSNFNLPIVVYLNTFGSTATLTNNTTWGTYTTGASQVYSGNLACGTSNAYVGVTTTPFLLPVSTNLMVLSEANNFTTGIVYFYGAAATNLGAYFGSGSAPTAGSTFANYPNRAGVILTFALPSITTQPATTGNMCLNSGNTTISIASSNTTTYIWQYNNAGTWGTVANGTPAGAVYTNPTNTAPNTSASCSLNIAGITAAGSYSYRCIVNNGNGASSTVTSGTSVITVASCCTNGTIVFTSGTQNQTVCSTNGTITSTVYTYGGGTTNNASVSGLPLGLTSNVNTGNSTVTISGTATAGGTYTITTSGQTGPCTAASISGTITYNPAPALAYTSGGAQNQTVCSPNSISSSVYTWGGGATGATFAAGGTGLTGTPSGSTMTVSGAPTAGGTYTITTTGQLAPCTSTSQSGIITFGNPSPPTLGTITNPQ